MPFELPASARIITQHRFFSACIILSLGVGISSAASVVAIVDSARFGKLPFGNADRIEYLSMQSKFKSGGWQGVPANAFRALKRAPIGEDVAAFQVGPFQVRDGEHVFSAVGARTTNNFASLLGARVALGRAFDSTDTSEPTVLLGYRFWRTELDGDSTVVGKTIQLSGRAHRVVGVATGEWVFPDHVAFWTSTLDINEAEAKHRRLAILVRRKPHVDAAVARAELVTIGTTAIESIRHAPNEHLVSTSFREYAEFPIAGAVFVLTIISVFVGFLTAVNFAALILARGIRRRGEIGVRAALGASVGRLARYIVGEVLILCALGGILAALLAPFIVDSLRDGFADILPVWLSISLSWRTIALSVVLTMLFGGLFALGPAFDLARPALAAFLRSAGSTVADGGRLARTRSWIVAIQVAVASGVLIALGALLGTSLLMREPTLGYDDRPLLVSSVSDSGRANDVSNRLIGVLSSVSQVPGVGVAGYLDGRYLDAQSITADLSSRSTTADAEGIDEPWLGRMSEQFFDVLRPRVVAGRLFTDDEVSRGASVAVVSRVVAHALFADEAVGKRVRIANDQPRTIVGVIDDIRLSAFQPDPTSAFFVPMANRELGETGQTTRQLWIRANAPVPATLRALESRVATNQFGVVRVVDTRSVSATVAREFAAFRSVKRFMLSIFGVALGLAALGIYGLVAYTAELRARELAVREALGATRWRVAGLVLKGALVQVVLGAVVGAMLAVLVVDYLNDFHLRATTAGGATIVAFGVVGLTVLVSSIGPLARTWRRDLSLTLRN